jgi:Tfp pilus assembly protein PilN
MSIQQQFDAAVAAIPPHALREAAEFHAEMKVVAGEFTAYSVPVDCILLTKVQAMIQEQQNDIIMLEMERDALKADIAKLKERNENQANLLISIEKGEAKKCSSGGWYKP